MNMVRLSFKKKVWIVKQFLKRGDYKTVALAQKIHWRTVYKLVSKYKEFGWEGLKDCRPGRPSEPLNPKMVDLIIRERKRTGYGACKLEILFMKKGFGVSHRKIHQVLLNEGLVIPNINKQKPRKYVRYELPRSNDLWHTDWTYCPFTCNQLTAYIDDSSRFVIGYGLFVNSFSEYSIAVLRSTIAEYQKPKAIMTDHGSQFFAMGGGISKFQHVLINLNIKHCLAPVGRPRVNGKIERWFQTYKEEYNSQNFKGIKDFIKWYNEERIHQSLGYRTPREVYEERLP